MNTSQRLLDQMDEFLRRGFISLPRVSTPRITVRCEYPDTDLPPTEVTFRLSPSYGLTTGHEANEWFIDMMREHAEFEVETDEPGEPPLSFWTETVRGVMVE